MIHYLHNQPFLSSLTQKEIICHFCSVLSGEEGDRDRDTIIMNISLHCTMLWCLLKNSRRKFVLRFHMTVFGIQRDSFFKTKGATLCVIEVNYFACMSVYTKCVSLLRHLIYSSFITGYSQVVFVCACVTKTSTTTANSRKI